MRQSATCSYIETYSLIRNLTPRGRHLVIVFGIFPREALLCGRMNFSHLQSCHTWVFAWSLVWSCSLKFHLSLLVMDKDLDAQLASNALSDLALPLSAATSQATLPWTLFQPSWLDFVLVLDQVLLLSASGPFLAASLLGISPPTLLFHSQTPQGLAPLGIFLETSSLLICSQGRLSFKCLSQLMVLHC